MVRSRAIPCRSRDVFGVEASACHVWTRVPDVTKRWSALRIGVHAVGGRGEVVDPEPADQKDDKGESEIPLQFGSVNLVAPGMEITEIGEPCEKSLVRQNDGQTG